jgi:excinuclease ABC subunit C
MSEVTQALKNKAHSLPKNPGVYFMKNEAGVIIYIGKAKSLKSRVSSYFIKQKDRPNRLKHLIKQIRQIDHMVTETEVEAFLLEASLIKKHKPKYNIRLKDDKSYPYIKLSLTEDFPRLNLARRVTSKKDLYYGPFTSSYLVRENIKFLNGLYKLRDCSNGFMKIRKRPCLTYEIKRCTAPCVDFVNKKQYQKQVKKALDFLEGRAGSVLEDIEAQMKESAKNEDFEKAAEYRDQLKAAELILEKQKVVSSELLDRDFISFLSHEKGTVVSMIHFRKGRLIGERTHFLSPLQSGLEESFREKALSFLNQYYLDNFIPDEVLIDLDLGRDLNKLFMDLLKERRGSACVLRHTYSGDLKDIMEKASKLAERKLEDYVSQSSKKEKGLIEIQRKFELEEYPVRMECYDISNFQGGQSVGSQVVFYEGSPSVEDYRIYKVKTVVGSDDFQSIKEVLSRRLAHNEYQDPQLIVIDGGKGQLSKAVEALKELGREDLKVVGLAKSREQGSYEDEDLKRTVERFFVPGRSNPITFKHHSEALKILTFMRDEAHRFAITHHRRMREKNSLEGAFEGVQGLGPLGLERLKEFLSKKSDWSLIDENTLRKDVKLNKNVREQVLFILHSLVKESKKQKETS